MYKIKELSQAAVGKLYWTVSYKERREWQEGSGFELLHKDCLSKAPVVTRDADDPAVEVKMHIKDAWSFSGLSGSAAGRCFSVLLPSCRYLPAYPQESQSRTEGLDRYVSSSSGCAQVIQSSYSVVLQGEKRTKICDSRQESQLKSFN